MICRCAGVSTSCRRGCARVVPRLVRVVVERCTRRTVTVYPFANDNAYYNPYYDDRYASRTYDDGYVNGGYVYDRSPVRTTYVVGSRLPQSVPLIAVPESVAIQVPATRPYSYATFNGRVYLVDPATGVIVADVTQ